MARTLPVARCTSMQVQGPLSARRQRLEWSDVRSDPGDPMSTPRCRFCDAPLQLTFVDLGSTPLANSYVDPPHADEPEPTYPLHALRLRACFLVQLESVVTPEDIFGDYAYFSSFSDSWLDHARRLRRAGRRAARPRRPARSSRSPATTATCCSTSSSAASRCSASSRRRTSPRPRARRASRRWSRSSAPSSPRDLADAGRAPTCSRQQRARARPRPQRLRRRAWPTLLAPGGVITIEFPHLLRPDATTTEFDTIYHEHFSYFSLLTVRQRLRARTGCALRRRGAARPTAARSHLRLPRETRRRSPRRARGGRSARARARRRPRHARLYSGFAERVAGCEADAAALPDRGAEASGAPIAGYGAPAKGNTLLNYCGCAPTSSTTSSTAARTSRARSCRARTSDPRARARLRDEARLPVILPWNLQDEITEQMATSATGAAGSWSRCRPWRSSDALRRDRARGGVDAASRCDRGRAGLVPARLLRRGVPRTRHRSARRTVQSLTQPRSRERYVGSTCRANHTVRRRWSDAVAGAIFDVVVDLRPDSPTFGLHHAGGPLRSERDRGSRCRRALRTAS